MGNQRWLDLGIMLACLAAMISVGLRFSRKQTSTETYFVAKRSIPSWAMGLSLVATLITSVTFVAYPGSSYGKNWSLLIPGFMVVGVLLLVGRIIIPFYRHVLAYFSRHATRQGVYAGIAASVLFTTWATLTLKGDNRVLDLGAFNYPPVQHSPCWVALKLRQFDVFLA